MELGYEGVSLDALEDEEDAILYYDYEPANSSSALLTSDEYFLGRVFVATSFAKGSS